MKPTEFPEIKGFLSEQHFKPAQTIFYAGNEPAGLYFLISGTVKLEAIDEDGKSQIIQMVHDHGIVGYRALFADEKYSASAIAVTEAKLQFLPKTAVKLLIEKHPEVALEFLSQMGQDMRTMQIRLQHATTHSAHERVAEALLHLRETNPERSWTRKEISEWAGTTPETVMRSLADFEEEGLVELKGRGIIIKNRGKLLKRAKISF